ncbi:serine O-acetyltransferase [Vibrio rumoiensis]|uniref:serine O-acetyltransferase n=1 Tax=Vibrio rumoiensis TaxID=76258 RepID=UPI003AA89B80
MNILRKIKFQIGKLFFNVRVESSLYRYINLYQKNFIFLSRFLEKRFSLKYGCYISRKAKIGKNISFRHPIGVVIGEGVEISDNVVIYQNVTIGAAKSGDAAKGLYPQIGKNTTIFSGAVIVGNIKVGDGCIIGANTVLSKDLPDNSVHTINSKRDI